jgi:hypothetical protein
MPAIPGLRRPGTLWWGEGTPRFFTAGMKVPRVRTRPDVSCCELIDVVQTTDYRVCDDLFCISAETETEVLLDRAVPVVRSICVAAND